jgi:hypothetical protein
MDIRIVLDCEDQRIRGAIMGVLAAQLEHAGFNVATKPLPLNAEIVETVKTHYDEVVTTMIAGPINITLVEQIEIPKELISGIKAHGLAGHMSTSIIAPQDDDISFEALGLSHARVEEILQDTYKELELEGTPMTDEGAQQICDEASARIQEYLEEQLPNCPIYISAHKRKTATGYDFTLAVNMDKEACRAIIKKRKKID